MLGEPRCECSPQLGPDVQPRERITIDFLWGWLEEPLCLVGSARCQEQRVSH